MKINNRLKAAIVVLFFVLVGMGVVAGLFPIFFLLLDIVIFGKKMGIFATYSITLAPMLGAIFGALVGLKIALAYIKKENYGRFIKK